MMPGKISNNLSPKVECADSQIRVGQGFSEKIGDRIVGMAGELLDRVAYDGFGVSAEFNNESRNQGEGVTTVRA